MGFHVLLHGRDPRRTDAALDEIRKVTGRTKLQGFVADLNSLRQVRKLAAEVLEQHDRLDVLINNAGVYEHERGLSEDGLEMTFAVNHVGPFLLTLLLLDLLRESAPSRIVNISSMIHAGTIDFENLQGEKRYSGNEAYCLSKLCNILFTYELAERLQGTGVTANCLHPGVINTKLLRASWSGGIRVTEGSRNVVYVATDPALENVTGKYFVSGRETPSSSISYDMKTRKKVWELSERLAGVSWGTGRDKD